MKLTKKEKIKTIKPFSGLSQTFCQFSFLLSPFLPSPLEDIIWEYWESRFSLVHPLPSGNFVSYNFEQNKCQKFPLPSVGNKWSRSSLCYDPVLSFFVFCGIAKIQEEEETEIGEQEEINSISVWLFDTHNPSNGW